MAETMDDHPMLIRSVVTCLVLGLAAWGCTPAPAGAGAGAEAGAGAGSGSQAAAPTPEALCQHVREVAAKDQADAEALDQVQRECVQQLGALEGRYRSFASCVDAAATAEAISTCEATLAKPPPLLAAVQPTLKLESLCDHVIELLEAQIGQAAPNMGPAELAKVRERCMTDAGAQVEKLGVAAFNAQADCLLAAQNLEQLQACGGFDR